MSAGPYFIRLGHVGGAAEQEAFQRRAVEGVEGPEIAEACEGRCGENRE